MCVIPKEKPLSTCLTLRSIYMFNSVECLVPDMTMNITRSVFILIIGYSLLVESSDILSLLRSNDVDFCFTNSSSAMFYIIEGGSVREATKIIPESPYICGSGGKEEDSDCSKDFEEKYWKNVNSLDYENIPIFDMRWEGLATEELNQTKEILSDELYFKEILYLNKSVNFKITLSLRSTEAHFFFCDKKNIKKASCYWFIIYGWKRSYTALRKCIDGIPFLVGKYPDAPCKDLLANYSHTDQSKPFLGEKMWRHITFEKQGRQFFLKDTTKDNDDTVLEYEDPNDSFDIKYMLGNSVKPSAYKLHKYDYLRTTVSSTEITASSRKEGEVINQKICFSMFLTTCQKCWIFVVAYTVSQSHGISSFQVLGEKKLEPSYGEWTYHKVIFSNVTKYSRFKIGFRMNATSDVSNTFWSIDGFRYCSPEEYRVSVKQNYKLLKCQLLSSSKELEWKEPTEVSGSKCESLDKLGGLCIPCDVLENNAIVGTCKKIHMCERNTEQENCFCSPGYIGSKCDEACEKGTYGYSCQQKCGQCRDQCAVENGYCNCDTLFEGLTCNIQRYVIPNFITSNSTSCSFQLLNVEQFEDATFFSQYQKEEVLKSHYWEGYNKVRNINKNNTIVVGDLEANTNYSIRILISRNSKSITDLLEADIPYTSCNTTCNAWNKSDIKIEPENETVKFTIHLSKDKCRVTSYRWEIQTKNGSILDNGIAQEKFLVEKLPVFTSLKIVFSGSNKISKEFKTAEGVPEPPRDLDIYWFKNNTFGLYWAHPSRVNGVLRGFKIEIKLASGWTTELNYTNQEYSTNYHLKVDDEVPFAADITVLVYTINTRTISRPTMKSNSSYPSVPVIHVTPAKSKNTTESTININMNVTLEGDYKKKCNNYLFVLISDPDSETEDENVKNLRNILNTTIISDVKLRICTEIDLDRSSSTTLDLVLGEHTKIRSKILNTDITNKPLEEGRLYKIKILAVRGYKRKFRTYCYDFEESTQGQRRKTSRHNGNEGTSTYALLLLLLLVPIIVGLLIFRKRVSQTIPKVSLQKLLNTTNYNLRRLRSTNDELVLESKESSPVTTDSDSRGKTNLATSSKSTNPPNPAEKIYSKRVKVANLEEYIKDTIASGELTRQHALFPRTQTQPCAYGSLMVNKTKNRYFNLVAYDHSRVKLKKLPGDEYSDYINANYIHGYGVPCAYIATQGPRQSTLGDFWRMIWQENTKHIIMVANVYEGGKKKVEQYWPNINEELNIQNISVKYMSVEIFADFEYRIFQVTRGEETRKLEQLHFTSWPDHGVPLYPQSLTPFLQKILSIRLSSSSPVVIHCSAGVGRTGTILLSDICLRMSAKEGVVDILNNLQQLREQRSNMVDNVEQYKLVHLVVLECLIGLHTSISCKIIEKTIKEMRNENEFKIQMDYLIETQWQDEAMKTVAEGDAGFSIYPEKNRFQDVVPDDKSGIPLQRYPRDDSSSSYINAVRVDGFRCPGRFIVTQQPMPNTLNDFWRLVVEQRTAVVISLNEVNLKDETCCQFVPTAKNQKIRPADFMLVSFKKMVKLKNYDLHHVCISMNNDQKQKFDVEIISFKLWTPGNELPSSCEEFLSFWEEADTISRRSQTILVTCYDGRKASGIYVALSFVIEKIKLEQECDVCLAVRNIRHNRKQFITEESQFIFLYEAALRFINGFESYANFENQ